MLADAGGTAADFQLAVLALHLVILPLLSQNNNMFPLRAFKRRHSKVLEALGAMCGGWGVVGGWLVQAQGTYQNSKNIRFRIIRVCRVNNKLYRMGRLKSPYDPSLILTICFLCLKVLSFF